MSALPRATVTRLAPAQPAPFPVQGTLALELEAPAPAPPETPELRTAGMPRVEQVSDAEVRAWAARLAQAVVECLAGRRPVSQLVRWTAPAVYRDLERRVRLVREATGGSSAALRSPADRLRPQVRSVHVCRPSATAAEVSVHVRHGARSRAVALRMERHGDRWLCTVLQFG
ncbi:Rv3235 family protein [Nocardioides caldifontis]|uniref:Rv3235 family protein n=1 Tax=Nocardioides caldifontis TaxID=2588938 RepID=UPI0011DF8EF8|nr:Rv3235 family protein [Nocardioides caldifontis]